MNSSPIVKFLSHISCIVLICSQSSRCIIITCSKSQYTFLYRILTAFVREIARLPLDLILNCFFVIRLYWFLVRNSYQYFDGKFEFTSFFVGHQIFMQFRTNYQMKILKYFRQKKFKNLVLYIPNVLLVNPQVCYFQKAIPNKVLM